MSFGATRWRERGQKGRLRGACRERHLQHPALHLPHSRITSVGKGRGGAEEEDGEKEEEDNDERERECVCVFSSDGSSGALRDR